MDIQNLTSVATSTPEQAASNIDNASTFGLSPVGDKAFNDTLAPKAEQAAKPTDASPAVHESMAQSTEHTALLTPDVPHLNFIDESIKRAGDFIHGRQSIDEQISSLALKRMNDPSTFSDADEGALDRLNEERQVSQTYRDAQPKKPIEMFSNFADMVNGPELADHIADFLGGIGDAVKESTKAPEAIRYKGMLGTAMSLAYGFGKSSYDHLAGTAYNGLHTQVDANGQPTNMDETTKRHIAMGVGIVGTALQVVPMAVGLGPASGVAEDVVLRSAVMNIAKQAATFGTANALTEATRIVGEEVGKTYDGTHASLVDGIVNASDKMVNGVMVNRGSGDIVDMRREYPYAERVASSFGSGAVAGGILGIGGELLGATSRVGGGAAPEGGAPNPDVGPQVPPEPPTPLKPKYLSDPELLEQKAARLRSVIDDVSKRDPETFPYHKEFLASNKAELEAVEGDIKNQRYGTLRVDELRKAEDRYQASQNQGNAVAQSVRALQFKQAMIEVNQAAEKTGVGKLAPGQLTDFFQKAFERSGLKKVFTTAGQLRDMLPGADAERLIGPVRDTLAGQENTPFEVDTHTVAEIARTNPKIWDATTVEPNGPTAKQAEVKLKSVATAVKERANILEQLGLKSEDVQAPPETNLVQGAFGKPSAPAAPFDLEGHVRRADEILKTLNPTSSEPKSKFKKLNMDVPTPDDATRPFHVVLGQAGKSVSDILDMRPEGVQPIKKIDDMHTMDELVKAVQNEAHPTPNEYIKVLQTAIDKGERGFGGTVPDHYLHALLKAELNHAGYDIDLPENIKSAARRDADKQIKELQDKLPDLDKLEAAVTKAKDEKSSDFEKATAKKEILKIRNKEGMEYFKNVYDPLEKPEKIAEYRKFIKDESALINKIADGPAKPATPDNAKLQAELDDIKQKVANHYKTNPIGQLLIGNWDEPDLEDVQKAGSEHVNAMTFTEAIQKVLPKADVQKINVAQQNARKATVDSIREAAQHEMLQVQDLQAGFVEDARMEEERARIADDPNFKIVDKFRAAGKVARKAKEISIYQIDPKFMTNDQIKKYADDPRLKEHGVFKKGGSNPDDVARLLGVKDGDEVLKILSATPTRDQVMRARAAANAVHDEQQARSSVDLNHTHVIRSINDKASNDIEEMRFMLDNEWPATKLGIKRIALPLPRMEELDAKADDIIKKTKLSDLDPRKFETGAKRNLRLAVKAILKNEIYAAFQYKEAEALNQLLYKKALIAVGFSNRDKKFARKMQRKESKQIMKDAGPLISNAFNEILSVWNLKPAKAPGAPAETPPAGDFNKWVMRTNKAGRGDFSVPAELSDVRQSVDDMTYEQFRLIMDRLRVLYRQAQTENRVRREDNKLIEQEESDDLKLWAKNFVSHIDDTHGTGGDKEPPIQKTIESGFQKAKNIVANGGQLLAAKQNILHQLDRGQTSGRAFLELEARMEGSGASFEKEGFTYVKKVNKWIHDSIAKANKVHGGVDSLEKKLLDIPELKDIRVLNYGKLTKGDLLCALANMGQKYTKGMLYKNTGQVSDQTWQTIFDKHLDTKDVIYMQTIVNLYKSPVIRDRTKELQERQGREVNFVKSLPFYHRGVKYPGGYIRVRTIHDYTESEAKRAQDFFEGKGASYFNEEEGDKWSVHYASQTTDQGYTERRKGNKEPLDLNFSGIFTGLFEIAHDHAYREPLADFFKKIRAPGVRPALVRAVGQQKVDTLIGTNLEIAGRPSANEVGYFRQSNNVIKRTLMRFGSGFSVGVIWGNMTAVAKQIEALPEMFNQLGPKSFAHAVHVNYIMATNPEKMYSMIKIASRIDPNLAKYIDNVSDETLSVLSELVPRKGQFTKKSASWEGAKEAGRGGKRSLLSYGYNMARVGGFMPHQWADTYTKVLQVFTVIKHVTAGDHPNYPKEKLDAMSEKEQFEAIQHVVAQLSTLTQIQSRHDLKAPIQKNLAMNWATFFWNYPRNIINNTVLDARRTWWESKDAVDKFKSGLEKRQAERSQRPGLNDRYTTDGGGGDQGPPGGGGGGSGGGGSGGGDGGSSGDDFSAARGHLGRAANIVLSHLVWRTVGAMIGLWAAGKTIKFLTDLEDINWKDPKSVRDGAMEVTGEIMQMNFEHSMISDTPVVNSINYALDNRKKYGMAEVRDPITQGLSSIATCWPAMKNILTLSKDPDRMQMRACLESESYIGLPVPVRGILKLTQYYNDRSVPNLPAGFHAQFKSASVEEMHKDLKEFVANPGSAPDHLVAEADTLAKQLIPDAVKVPDNAADAIKMAMTGGQPGRDGLYGFTKEDWGQIKRQAPELGLTENGRNSQDSTQQEKAINWSLHNDAAHLEEKDLPVNTGTLFGAHVLGVQAYEKLFNAPGDAKVKAVFGDELKGHPELANFKTIGQVKSYLNEKVDKGSKSAQGDNKLTLKTSNNED